MEKLFENTTAYTPEEYAKFLRFHQKKFYLPHQLHNLFFLGIFLFYGVTFFYYSDIGLSILFILIAIAFISWRILSPNFVYKKEITSKKIVQHVKNTFSFYRHRMEVSNEKGCFSVCYFSIRKVFETEDAFYLYIDKTHSFVLSKTGFSLGLSQDFSKFIKRKVHLGF